MRYLVYIVVLLITAGAGSAAAQGKKAGIRRQPPHVMFERLNKMTPEQRERMLSRLPPERRRNFEQRLARYNKLTPEQRRRLREDMNVFQQLPPEKQQAVRGLMRRFSEVPEQRRTVIRDEFQELRYMTEDERRERVRSPEFRNRFNQEERRILEGLARHLPPPDDE